MTHPMKTPEKDLIQSMGLIYGLKNHFDRIGIPCPTLDTAFQKVLKLQEAAYGPVFFLSNQNFIESSGFANLNGAYFYNEMLANQWLAANQVQPSNNKAIQPWFDILDLKRALQIIDAHAKAI